MSRPYGPFTVAAGNLADIETAQYPQAATAIFINESPFTLKVTPMVGSDVYVVPAYTQHVIPLGNQYSGVIKVLAAADVTVGGTAPVSVLYVQTYAQGEAVSGTYPAALTRLTNVGNSVPLSANATSVTNDGNATNTQFIEATPTGFASSAWDGRNDGGLTLSPLSNAAQVPALKVVPGGGAGVFAKVQMDNGQIVTDGQGNLTINPNLLFIKRTAAAEKNYIQLQTSSSSIVWNIRVSTTGPSMDFQEQNAGVVPLRLVDDGSLQAGGPMVLATGNQESGHFHYEAPAAGAGNLFVIWMPFKMKMTNVPSSISYSGITNTNITGISVSAVSITLYGFGVHFSSAAGGAMVLDLDWVTVGN